MNDQIGVNVALNKSYRDEIETLNWDEIPFKYHRQSFKTPHVYIATRPTRLWGSSGDLNLQIHTWDPTIVTTGPWQILFKR